MYRYYVKSLFKHVTAGPFKLSVRNYLTRRALMYVPADSTKKINKALGLAVDSIVLDCEDGVALNKKQQARTNIRELLDKGKPQKKYNFDLAIRMNSVDSDLEKDVSTILAGAHLPDTIVLPKVNSESDLKTFADLLKKYITVNGKVELIMGIESALAFLNLESILRSSKQLEESSKFLPVGVFFGSDDFCASIGATRTESSLEVLYARQKLILAAKAFNFQVIDMVYIKYKDLEGLKKQSEEGAQLGFTGKQVIHPDQVPIVQKAFSPSEEKIAWACELLTAYHEHQQSGTGAFVFKGQMIDVPTMRQAQNIVDLANSIAMTRDL